MTLTVSTADDMNTIRMQYVELGNVVQSGILMWSYLICFRCCPILAAGPYSGTYVGRMCIMYDEKKQTRIHCIMCLHTLHFVRLSSAAKCPQIPTDCFKSVNNLVSMNNAASCESCPVTMT